MLREMGINPKIVQKLLGHKNIKTTLGTYSHVQKEVVDSVSNLLGDVYTKTVGGVYAPVIPEAEVLEIMETEMKDFLD